MTKWIVRGLVAVAVAAGLFAVAPQLVSGDHLSAAPAVSDQQVVLAAADVQDDADLAVDLNNWQESRVVLPTSGSKFRPSLQPKFRPGRATGRPRLRR